MKSLILLLTTSVLLTTAFAFVDIKPGKEVVFKVEWHLSVNSNDSTYRSPFPAGVTAKMTGKAADDDWYVFQLSDYLIKKERDAENPFRGLDTEFKIKVIDGKIVEFKDAAKEVTIDWKVKEMILRQLCFDYNDHRSLQHNVVEDDSLRIKMPLGECIANKVQFEEKHKETLKIITAKSNVHDCILSDEMHELMPDTKLDDFSNDSYSSYKLIVDSKTNQLLGVKGTLDVTVVKSISKHAILTVFINYIDTHDI